MVEPPSPEKLKVIHDLVAAATGLDTARGDQLVVEAFPFEATLTSEPLSLTPLDASPNAPTKLPLWLARLMAEKNIAVIAGVGAAAALVLAIGFFVLLRRTRNRKVAAIEMAAALEAAKNQPLALTPQEAERQLHDKLSQQSAEKTRQEAEALMKLKLPAVSTKKTEILIKHIGAEAKKDPTAMAQVVRTWLHDSGQR